MQFDSKLWKIYHVDERTAFTYVISQKRVPLSQFCMYCIIYFQGTTLKIYTVFCHLLHLLLFFSSSNSFFAKDLITDEHEQMQERRQGTLKRTMYAAMRTPKLWRRSPKAWMKAARTARLPCGLWFCADPVDCDPEAAAVPCEWLWPWECMWPPWFNKKPILNRKKKKKKKEHLLCSTCYCSHNSPPLKNTHVYIEWETHTQTHMRLTATPTAAVMIMTSPSMLKSWFTVRWTASKSSIAVRM